jgi:hypothetical protein
MKFEPEMIACRGIVAVTGANTRNNQGIKMAVNTRVLWCFLSVVLMPSILFTAGCGKDPADAMIEGMKTRLDEVERRSNESSSMELEESKKAWEECSELLLTTQREMKPFLEPEKLTRTQFEKLKAQQERVNGLVEKLKDWGKRDTERFAQSLIEKLKQEKK